MRAKTKTTTRPATERYTYDLQRSHGFTLIELLTVISLIALLSTLASPALSSLFMGGKFDRALVQAAGSFDRAREYAVCNSAYSYVGFTDVDGEGKVAIATFGAADASAGIQSLTESSSYVLTSTPASSQDLALLDRIIRVEGCAVEDVIPDGSALRTLPGLAGGASPLRPAGPKFSYVDGPRGTLRFTRIVQFTPDGAARVFPAIADSLQLILVPTRGSATSTQRDEANTAAIRIAGLTGQVKVYRR